MNNIKSSTTIQSPTYSNRSNQPLYMVPEGGAMQKNQSKLILGHVRNGSLPIDEKLPKNFFMPVPGGSTPVQ